MPGFPAPLRLREHPSPQVPHPPGKSRSKGKIIAQSCGGAEFQNQVGTTLLEAAIEVHRQLGCGLLESVYETVLAYELT